LSINAFDGRRRRLESLAPLLLTVSTLGSGGGLRILIDGATARSGKGFSREHAA
jgi:hypothetical protein